MLGAGIGFVSTRVLRMSSSSSSSRAVDLNEYQANEGAVFGFVISRVVFFEAKMTTGDIPVSMFDSIE